MGTAVASMTDLVDHEVHYGAKEVGILGFWREVLQNYLFLHLKRKCLRDVSLLTNDLQKLSLLSRSLSPVDLNNPTYENSEFPFLAFAPYSFR